MTVVVSHSGGGRFAVITAREGDASEPIRLEPTFWSMAQHRALAIRKRAELERPAFTSGFEASAVSSSSMAGGISCGVNGTWSEVGPN